MIMLVMLLSSLLIQFGAITLPNYGDNMDIIWDTFLNSKNNEEALFLGDSKNDIPYVCFFDTGQNVLYFCYPTSVYNSSATSSFSCSDLFTYRDNQYFNINMTGFNRISFNAYLNLDKQLVVAGYKYTNQNQNFTQNYPNMSSYIWNNNDLANLPTYVNSTTRAFVPVYMNKMQLSYDNTIYFDCLPSGDPGDKNPWLPLPYEGAPIGSLGPNGHSNSTHNDFSGLGWGHSTGSVYVTGHSTGVNPNDTTPDWTNPIQNLLGQAVNNLDKLIQNSGEIGTRIEYLGDNMINGISYLFNGISTFNDNVNGYLDYITAPVDDEIIYAHYEETALNETLTDIQDTLDSLDSSVSQNMVQVQSGDLGYRIQFNNSILGSFDYTIDFSFLDSSKNLWQPLLIALMYFTLISAILTGLPSIIQGFKGGGSDG